MKELKYIKIILNILILVNVTTQQILPPVPCPQIFSYKYDQDKNEYYGELRISNPNRQNINLLVNLTVAGQVSNYGNLALLHGQDQAKLDLMAGLPIRYKIEFPPYNIPRLTSVIANGAIVCSGPEDTGYRATIQLNHAFKSTFINLSVDNDDEFLPNLPSSKVTTFAPPVSKAPSAASSQSTDEICGTITATVNLAINGEAIEPGSWPWLAAIFIYNGANANFTYKCAGTLVSSRIVITAAHCFKKRNQLTVTPNDHVKILLGRFNLQDSLEAGATTNPIKDIKIHSDYRSDIEGHDADVAVVILLSSVTYTSTIRPACMLANDDNFSRYIEGFVVGWGRTKTTKLSPTPQKVKTEIVTELQCLRLDASFRQLTTNRTFCAGYLDGSGPCTGDSGTGFLVRFQNKWYLRGIVANSLHDAITECDLWKYVVYADIPKFSSWILSYTNLYR